MNEKRTHEEENVEKIEEIEADPKKNVFMFVRWKEDWLLFTLGVLFMSIAATSTPLNTWLYGGIMGKLSEYFLKRIDSYEQFINECLFLCGMIMVVGVGKMVFVLLGVYVWMLFGEKQQQRARAMVFRKCLNEDANYYDLNPNIMGNLTQVNRCIEEVRSGTSEVIGETVQTLALIIGLTVMSFYQSWAITLIILASAPVMAAVSWYFGRRTCICQQDENEKSSMASKILDWCLISPTSVRVFNGKYVEIVKFTKFVQQSAHAYYGVANAISANTGFLKFITLMMFVQGFWFGNYLLSRNSISINQLFTCFSSCLMLGQAVSGISQLMAIMNTAHAAAGRVSTYLQGYVDKGFPPRLMLFPGTCFGGTTFDNVSFKYPARDNLVLDGVTFTIREGQMNYLVGSSGSGKSTMPLLLMKLYEPSSGSITVDGFNVNLLDSAWVSQSITLVQQAPMIFDGTVRDNIALAVVDEYDSLDAVPLAQIQSAAEFAMLDVDLNLKVSATSLSGGQQQRLAIARAKLKDSPILILDESFSALDSQVKLTLIRRVNAWRRGRTTIQITHEYNYIEPHEHVILLDKGRIVGEGQFYKFASESIVTAEPSDKSSYEDTTAPTTKSISRGIYEEKQDEEHEEQEEIGAEKSDRDEQLMGILAILKYCSHTIDAKLAIVTGITLSVLEGGASPVFSYCFSRLLSTTMSASIGLDMSREIVKWSVVSTIIACFIGVTAYVSRFLLTYSAERWVIKLRKLVLRRINGQDMSYFFRGDIKPAKVTTLMMNDTRDLRNLVSSFLSIIITLITMVLAGIIWSIVSGWKLALVGVSFVPLIFLITSAYGRILESAENRYKTSVATLESHLYQMVTLIKTIKLYHMNRFFEEGFKANLKDLHHQGKYRAFQNGAGMAINELVTAIATGVILYFGMQLTGKFEYTHGQLMSVVTLLTFTLANASNLIHELPEITRGQRAGTFIVNLLEETPFSKIENDGELIPRASSTNEISFNSVSFKYDESKYILRNASFAIQKGQLVGLVGKSGSGKSTVSSLILRLTEPESGVVQIYDEDISKVNVDWLRETVNIVPQFPKFFEGSILENLEYGINPTRQVAMDEVNEYLDLCGMYDFVVSLPEGVHTRVGEGANTLLSGGQLQRLSIVRALLRRPRILIFDECTSNLDPKNTKLIMDLIMNLKHRYTIICITHDEQMMSCMERLFILENGSILESRDSL
ncbi:uncharacterized protein LODBEIA_P34680 [Lodderomyces beijingensis]|uniref:Uncharacterized protein n=1 Tax=Lodderomyces beijingensis TaxID=1775926 RepID=A0ABP0ZMV0_9ASCO